MLLPSFSSPPDVQASHRGRMEEALAAKCNKYSWGLPTLLPTGPASEERCSWAGSAPRAASDVLCIHRESRAHPARLRGVGWPRSDECLHASPSAPSSPSAFLGFKMLPPSSKGWKPRGLLWFSAHLAQQLTAQISSGHNAR